MNSTGKKEFSNKTQKINVRLEQDLSEAYDSFKWQKSELVECRKKLEQAKINITNLEEILVRSSSTEKKFERLQINIKNISEKINQLKQEIEKLKYAKQKVKK